jgi:5-oxoprolinase (ATP-hydrolysing) subunit C
VSVLEVVEPGLLSTVQGHGRSESAGLGVPVGGACDGWSLALANALLGNPVDAPALEMTMRGPVLKATDECWLALAGADMEAVVDGQPVGRETPVRLRAGQRLELGAARHGSGVRAYMALPGGIDVPEVLGSASTCLIGGFGGVEGRALRSGDRLSARLVGPSVIGRWNAVGGKVERTLRVVPGPHVEQLPGAFEALLAAGFAVGGRADRQGIRLEGPPLPAATGSILSQPMAWGAVQLPPDGRPIVLLADHQTVGGYPVVAVVVGADLPRLGQLGPGDEVRFVEIGLNAARAELIEWRRQLAMLPEVVAVGV